MERDVFSEFNHFMIHLDSEASAPELGIVRLLSDFSLALARLEEEAINDLSSDNARQAERILRGRIRDAINELPVTRQGEAWEKKSQRRLIWQRYYDRHELQRESEDTASGKLVVTQGSCQTATNPKRRWWRRFFVFKLVSKGYSVERSFSEIIKNIYVVVVFVKNFLSVTTHFFWKASQFLLHSCPSPEVTSAS
ncbi:hypothetical protein LCI18_011621 [Fusarium solani-melongenae]|uniref:Uncharacterized protein n=1 Tax=Fusarium solani subsp. cucurbitae TaxID=2747967 RepID=A0ACD3ZIL4_FUSSC|nr:hypothetical protein LCI18_011621 [Fusarium solani-melongenae]